MTILQSPNPPQNWTRNICPKTALNRKKDHCIRITKYASLICMKTKHFFFKLLRIFFRNPLKNETLNISQFSSEEMSTDSDDSNLYSSYAEEINRFFFLFYMIIVGILYFGGTPILIYNTKSYSHRWEIFNWYVVS